MSIKCRNIFVKALCGLFFLPFTVSAQLAWINMDNQFPGLPASVHVYATEALLNGRPNKAWYLEADLKDRKLVFETDTVYKRRLTPSAFFDRNDHPLAVVNGTFFSFTENRNLNLVIQKGRLLAYNVQSFPGRGKDTFLYHKMTRSAIGISKKRKADVAWLFTDTSKTFPVGFEADPISVKDSVARFQIEKYVPAKGAAKAGIRKRWKMETAIGGGPVLVQNGKMRITNDLERMFTGKSQNDLHPRTAMGYTANGKLIILVVEGRNAGKAEGASLPELANIFLSLGAVEALNLDGGGSSCMLVQGKETIKPSDKEGQRAVPAVFMIKNKH
jgi:exopolysaccharide biosynthesis protein